MILIVAAHPDDEVLGCGGSIARHAQTDHEVYLIIMADGVTSRSYNPDYAIPREKEIELNKIDIAKRKNETMKSSMLLGIQTEHIYHLNLADQRLDQYPLLDLAKRIEKIKKNIQPEIVYTHFWNDLNLDHRLTFQAVATAFRPGPKQQNVSFYQFEVPESTYLSVPHRRSAFIPDHFVDISHTLDLKLKALEIYESERREYPDMRSSRFIKELAQERGKIKNFKYAEAFLELKDG